ncbi:metallo-mystery pair system four-Cys motif protein [Leptospira gomenensis]|uniref:Metallo-mystery pair system four-Cys motif protein n=1 Tax=Leptospira gomenensis TaxID=2484974 RepID=A0A5F1YGJ7_9LEPT|nr:MbnP family copper-binding protein [Leptospira gomenensis]TGK31535.1 metallo-mystery pair system four-Cys motif protein [Leptospira gomenensis]TGK44185.1 metallo-mystery pair system four-Cys motif protein [Leptospira gomenensis]TGK46240.1 metallo-mystery pair system four-Cys motif protein [Leptospira gomenensis]TGK54765.1 metallo-mystery pair system four-Cys motif protein [Leptospira gomenensis]
MFKKTAIRLWICIFCVSLVHCPWDKKKDDNELLTMAAAVAFSGVPGIQFGAYAGTQKLQCGATLRGHENVLETVPFIPNAHIAESTTFRLHDFRLYVHGVALITDSGEEIPIVLNQDGKFQTGNVSLLDFEDKTGQCDGTVETNNTVSGNVPSGIFRGVKFIVGVPEELNHLDADNQPAPLNLSGMFWGWTGGYKFLKLDFETDETVNAAQGASFHIGGGDCTGTGSTSTCARANRIPVTLTPEGGFNPATQEIKIDIQALLQGIDLAADPAAVMCMSATAGMMSAGCATLFPNIGLVLATGQPQTAVQPVFKIKPKN